MSQDEPVELLSVELTSSGLETALQQLKDRVDDLESRNQAQHDRLASLGEKGPEVDVSKRHLCEVSSIQSLATMTPEQQMSAVAEAIVSMGHNVNQFYKDVKHREAVQHATDSAQDELMHMELDRIGRELVTKFTHQGASGMRKAISVEMKSMREEMEQAFEGRLSLIDEKVSEQLLRVMDQVRTIKESTQVTNGLLMDRIEDAFSDIQRAGEDVDDKIRVITALLGLDPSQGEEPPPSFQEVCNTIADLQRNAEGFREEIDTQSSMTEQVSEKVDELRGAVHRQAETLTETLKATVGEGVTKMISELERSLRDLESKVEGEMADLLGDCSQKLEALTGEMQEKETSTEAVEAVQDALMEQARAQEENMQIAHDDLLASVEKSVAYRLTSVRDEMALLEKRLEETVVEGKASADKMNAIDCTSKILSNELGKLQKAAGDSIRALEEKISESMATVNGRIGGLSDEITKLQRTVSDHHSELGSHVTTSKAFVQATTEHQVMWDAKAKVAAQELALYKGENGDRMDRLERSNVSVVITLRGVQRSVDALATKEGRWDRLEVQNRRHVQVLGGHLAELEGAATFSEPFSLSPSVQKHLSAVSQMVSKNIATRADYEITRQAVNRKNPAEDSDWDSRVEMLRNRYLDKFVTEVVEVARRLRPLPDRPIEEVRETFATKLELSMRLAISKYKPIQAGATILGKVQLLPSCMACDRPFIDNPGPGDTRSVVQDHRGDFQERTSRSRSPLGAGNRSPGGTTFPARGQWSKRDRSPSKKYVMRSGFKMRQTCSEGGGLVTNTSRGFGDDSTHLGARLAFGLEGVYEAEGGEGGGAGGRGRRKSREDAPRDKISGSPLNLRPSAMSAQVGTRGTRGTHSSTIRDQEGLAGRRATTGKARGGVVGDGDDAEEHPWVEEKNAGNPPTVHLPTLR
eukprot:jgi/Undpi1/12807/HiC_scaffold_7.g02474.m1